MGWFDNLKAAAADKTTNLVTAGVDRLRGTLNDLAGLAPQLEKIGYRIEEMTLEMGLSPSVILYLERLFEAGEEAFQAASLDKPDSRMLTLLIKVLRQVNAAHRGLQLKDRDFRGVEIIAGIPPIVRMRYGRGSLPESPTVATAEGLAGESEPPGEPGASPPG